MVQRKRPSIKGSKCTVTSRGVPWSRQNEKNNKVYRNLNEKGLQIGKRKEKSPGQVKEVLRPEGKFRAQRGGGEEKKRSC